MDSGTYSYSLIVNGKPGEADGAWFGSGSRVRDGDVVDPPFVTEQRECCNTPYSVY